MAHIELPIPELEDVLKHSSPAKRADMLSRITDLFLQNSTRYAPEHIEVFDNVLCRLIDESEAKTLAVLSRRLASVANAPVRTVGRLAHVDDITIAEPVLLHSLRIDESILTYVIQTKSPEHLLAIACRTEVGPPITDLLIKHGDAVVVRYLTKNPGARFSNAAFETLAKNAETDGTLAELLCARRDVSPQLKSLVARHAGSTGSKKNVSDRRPATKLARKVAGPLRV